MNNVVQTTRVPAPPPPHRGHRRVFVPAARLAGVALRGESGQVPTQGKLLFHFSVEEAFRRDLDPNVDMDLGMLAAQSSRRARSVGTDARGSKEPHVQACRQGPVHQSIRRYGRRENGEGYSGKGAPEEC